MKKIIILQAMMVGLFLCSCSTGTSNDSSNTTTTQNELTKSDSTPVTMSNIVGSWIVSGSGSGSSSSGSNKQYYTYTEDIIRTISSDATFTDVETRHYTDSTNTSNKWITGTAYKGSVSISGETVTWTYTNNYYNDSGSVDLAKTIAWTDYSEIDSRYMEIIDGHLCYVYKRQGTGDDIIGTWVVLGSETYNHNPEVFYKNVLCFTATEATSKHYEDETGAFDTIHDASTGSYTIGTNNTIIVNESNKTTTLKVYLSSTYIALGNQATKL